MFGDILFYVNDGSLAGNLISWRTHSKFVHVAVRFTETAQVAAMNNGVVLMNYVPTKYAYRPRPAISAMKQDYTRNWLYSKIGDQYSYQDIFDDLFGLSGRMLLIGNKAFDCSHLAASFLDVWGDLVVAKFPHLEVVTPGDLAHACGLVG